ncbi:MAG TPA: HIRAN domain-containing protein [Stellaceae bacterium]|nr:HIRAN domain-containing protein [Stellaceae bacterium]
MSSTATPIRGGDLADEPICEFGHYLAGLAYPNSDGSSRVDALGGVGLGTALVLVPEDDNPVDPQAIAVYAPDGRQLGYLHRGLAEEVRGWAAEGLGVTATVESASAPSEQFPVPEVRIAVRVSQLRPPGVPADAMAMARGHARSCWKLLALTRVWRPQDLPEAEGEIADTVRGLPAPLAGAFRDELAKLTAEAAADPRGLRRRLGLPLEALPDPRFGESIRRVE